MKTILFQGDSITDCGRYRKATDKKQYTRVLFSDGKLFKKKTALGDGYPAMVSSSLEKAFPGEYKFFNRGVGGDKITSVYERMQKDIIALKPDCMSLLIGVNDVWHRYDFGQCGTTAEKFEEIYDLLLSEVKAEIPGIKLIIMGPFVLEGTATENRDSQPDRYAEFTSEVARLAAIAEKLAGKYGCPFIDLQSVFDEAVKSTPAKELLSDGVHPTEKGHSLITEQWLAAYSKLR